MIKINRTTGFIDKAREYKVMVDDRKIGILKDGDTIFFDLPKGEHTIYLKIDWCRSNKVNFFISEDEVIAFDCGNSLNGWKIFFNMIYITFLKNQYLWLKIKDKSDS